MSNKPINFYQNQTIRFVLIWERLTELIKISSYWTYIDWLFLLWRFETYRLRLINLANFQGLIMNLEIKIYKIFWPIIGVFKFRFIFMSTIPYVVVLDYNITREAYYNIDFFFPNMSHILYTNLHHIPLQNINVLFPNCVFLKNIYHTKKIQVLTISFYITLERFLCIQNSKAIL